MRRNRKPRMIKPGKLPFCSERIILTVAFLVGALAGCLSAGRIPPEDGSSLISYLEQYLSAAEQGRLMSPGIFVILWNVLKWPVVVMLFSFTAIGLVGIPTVFCIRGFLLSFAISALVRVMGNSGMIVSAVVFGITGLISFPILFLLGIRGMALSRFAFMGKKHSRPLEWRQELILYLICFAILIFCVFLEQSAVLSILMILAQTVL